MYKLNNGYFNHNKPVNTEIRSKIVDDVIQSMNLSKNDVVFDIGSGDGFYSSKFADLSKKVYSIDEFEDNFQSEYYLKNNITTIPQNVCDWLKTNDFSEADCVFFSNSFHDMECQEQILKKIQTSLKKGRYLDLIEFNLSANFGPPVNIRFSKEMLKSKVESYGFKEVKYLEFENHYFISFQKI